ncbi:MAG TPA: S53 family peptidase [Candidatus Eremiobacteraceae bacterium]|nr:S53 family peptidase [Candidatus Eremiobacteraceae bacterium]
MTVMRISKSGVGLIICALTALAAAACGGGGGSATPAIVQPSPSPTGVSCQVKVQNGVRPFGSQVAENFSHALVPIRVGPGPAMRVCPTAGPGEMRCFAWLRTDMTHMTTPGGYGPSDLQSAYSLTASSLSGGVGQTVVIVDAYNDPNAESDLATYRSTFGLSVCSTANGCFLKVNQNGKSAPLPGTDATGGWEAEESLDLDMVSAICPNCHITLIEAKTAVSTNFYAAEDTAAGNCGATEISNSWGTTEYSQETSDDSHFTHAGIMITASAGDNGYSGGVSFPAASAHVTAVGGTALTHSGSVWSETAWSGTGSGCSIYIGQPSWQVALGSAYTNICGKRIINDVSAVASPNTPVAVYDTFGGTQGCTTWCLAGGTSASAPLIAAVYAVAGNGSTLMYASNAYANTGSLTDVTTGKNGMTCGGDFLCTAQAGYDGPTGLGTPIGTGAF